MIRFFSSLYSRNFLYVLFNYGIAILLITGGVAINTIWDLVTRNHEATANSISKGMEFHTLTTIATNLQFKVSVALDPQMSREVVDSHYNNTQEIFSEIRKSEDRLQLIVHPTQQIALTELIDIRKQLETQVGYFYTQIRHNNTGLARELIYNELEPVLQDYITKSASAEHDALVYSDYLLNRTVVNTNMAIIALVVVILFTTIILASKLRVILGDFTYRHGDSRQLIKREIPTKETTNGT